MLQLSQEVMITAHECALPVGTITTIIGVMPMDTRNGIRYVYRIAAESERNGQPLYFWEHQLTPVDDFETTVGGFMELHDPVDIDLS